MMVLSDSLSAFLARHEHITLELALINRSVNPAEEGFDLAISGHAASSYEGVIDVPLYPFFLEGVATEAKLNQADGLHPTAEGVDVIVKNILPSVEAFLGALSAQRS
jgi:lysophospholipase L1-like esterase